MLLNTVDPGLKIAGVTRRWESKSFQILWTPDRGIQGWRPPSSVIPEIFYRESTFLLFLWF